MTEEFNPKLEPQPGLGRVWREDRRDRAYALENPARAAAPIRRRHWISRGPVLDQGGTSHCVAYATSRWLTTDPVRNKPVDTKEFYTACQRSDEWPGEEPRYFGTSVRAAMKQLKLRGLVSEYRWAFDCETVINHVLSRGPVIMGTDWTMDMFMPDRWGYIRPTGESAGGHAWLIVGADRDRVDPLTKAVGAIRMLNSWGASWGQKGRAWITFADLDDLISRYGEAAVAIEKKAA